MTAVQNLLRLRSKVLKYIFHLYLKPILYTIKYILSRKERGGVEVRIEIPMRDLKWKHWVVKMLRLKTINVSHRY